METKIKVQVRQAHADAAKRVGRGGVESARCIMEYACMAHFGRPFSAGMTHGYYAEQPSGKLRDFKFDAMARKLVELNDDGFKFDGLEFPLEVELTQL